jgi:flagellar protein FlgJ
MTTPLSIDTGQAKLAAAPAADDRDRLREVAEQFEAIFLRQMLSAARSTDFGGNDLFGGQGEDTFQEMRDARFADIAADSGAIGLGASIEKQLARYIGKA